MQVKVTGRHMGVSDAVKQYCQEKSEKLVRFNDRITLIDVVVDGHAGKHSVELIAHVEGTPPFVATEHNGDIYAAFDIVIEKVERQLRDDKEKRRNRKHMVRPPEEESL